MSKFFVLSVILAIAFVLPSVAMAQGPDEACYNPPGESTPEVDNPPTDEAPPETETPEEDQPTEEPQPIETPESPPVESTPIPDETETPIETPVEETPAPEVTPTPDENFIPDVTPVIGVPVSITPVVPIGMIDNPPPDKSHETCGNGQSCDNEDIIIIPASTEMPLQEMTQPPMILPETGGESGLPGYVYVFLAGLVLLTLGISTNVYVLVALKRIK
jgi:hypothetical protein